ncbi:hypothetical protein QCB45_08575 [Thiomicrorhabdus sp. ZW0627]|uniref:hypothetical protein n=1 Tax=Thiomicrorhabdus sp. ZW0627 TaxID=3039774 RepID=UPI0024373C1F|nr:hypothetical protein [Thiomicrorhabdus sp. ZW0627]MDG6774386.1 hypothetical protein [Thiomicrorhabdus sp. ZW0627]
MKTAFRETNALEKLFTSLINTAVVFLFLLPFLWFDLSIQELKWVFIGLFLLENLLSILISDYRLPGMILQNTHWKQAYSKPQQLLHALLYTASFSTLLFWVWIPGDLLILNLLLLQLPCILMTGTTLHGWLSGGMVDVKKIRPH